MGGQRGQDDERDDERDREDALLLAGGGEGGERTGPCRMAGECGPGRGNEKEGHPGVGEGGGAEEDGEGRERKERCREQGNARTVDAARQAVGGPYGERGGDHAGGAQRELGGAEELEAGGEKVQHERRLVDPGDEQEGVRAVGNGARPGAVQRLVVVQGQVREPGDQAEGERKKADACEQRAVLPQRPRRAQRCL